MLDIVADSPRPAGILLTGGASRRMGFDKTALLVDGVPCAERVGSVMVRVLDPVLEVGPGRSGRPNIREDPPGAGPLAAVVAGFTRLRVMRGEEGPVVVVAGDQPLLTEAALAMLASWPGPGSVVPVVEGRAQPLCARWSPEAQRAAEEALGQGERSMRPLLEFDDVELVVESRWPEGVTARAFDDIDRPADLKRLGLS
jgi:molybdopterin-guanine dinucleotide biosynthesis protein A